jgi:amidophosphoribosyltransferase
MKGIVNAWQVYLASASPPVRYPNVFGVDMPTRREFVAYGKTEDEICAELGADGLLYQSVDDLISVGKELNPAIQEFEASCFTGASTVPTLGLQSWVQDCQH